MTHEELEAKIFYAIKFIVKPLAVPDQVVVDAAEAAAREIVRYQKTVTESMSPKQELHENHH